MPVCTKSLNIIYANVGSIHIYNKNHLFFVLLTVCYLLFLSLFYLLQYLCTIKVNATLTHILGTFFDVSSTSFSPKFPVSFFRFSFGLFSLYLALLSRLPQLGRLTIFKVIGWLCGDEPIENTIFFFWSYSISSIILVIIIAIFRFSPRHPSWLDVFFYPFPTLYYNC